MRPQDIIAIVGPTCSGKSALAMEIARRVKGEIISADAMQCYRGMEIGTAAPTAADRAAVPHHFVACINPDEDMAAGEYQRRGRAVLASLRAQGKTAIVCGGSGLYLRALLDGLFEGPGRDAVVRARLRAEAAEAGNAAMMQRLRALDPEYADTLTSENDLVRIIRALEVHEITGLPFSQWHARHRSSAETLPARWFGLLWERDTLYTRIDARVDTMIAEGWIEEVAALRDAGYVPQLSRLKAHGYREILAYLEGRQPLDAALSATRQHHRRYAKRQMTWFRPDRRIRWLPARESVDVAALADCVLADTAS
jgi:tRNA dimethylallyltransferase